MTRATHPALSPVPVAPTAHVGSATPPEPAASPEPLRLHRDRTTWALYAAIATHGWFVYSFSPAVALLREEQEVSRAVAGLHGMCIALGAILAGLFGARVVAAIGRRHALQYGLVLVVSGMAVVASTTALPLTLAAALTAGTGGSVVANTVAVALTAQHGRGGAAAASEANALASALGVLAPLALGAAVLAGLGWRIALLAVAVPAGLALVLLRRSAVPEAPVLADPISDVVAGVPPWRRPTFRWAWLALVLGIAAEFATVFWAGEVVSQQAGLSQEAGASTLAGFLVGMTFARVAAGRLGLRVDAERLLLASFLLAAVAALALALSPTAAVGVGALVLLGAGIGAVFPVGMVRAVRAAGGQPDRAAALCGLGAGFAIAATPFGLGAVADQVGTSNAFLVVPVLCLLGAGACLRVRRSAG